VWSRIDADTMTAKQLSFFKTKLMAVSRELYLEHGWKMPRGMANPAERNPTNFTLAEWQQAKRQGVDPRWTAGRAPIAPAPSDAASKSTVSSWRAETGAALSSSTIAARCNRCPARSA
jgi:hypothetical protein